MSIMGNKPLSSVYGAVTGSEIDEESAQKMAKSGNCPNVSSSNFSNRATINRLMYDRPTHNLLGASAAYEYASKEVLILKK